jgi:hypothetical protein
MMTKETAQEQLNLVRRLQRLETDGWHFEDNGGRFRIGYPEPVRRDFGLNEYAHIHVLSSDLAAALVAAETAMSVLDMVNDSGKLKGSRGVMGV